MNEQIEQPEQPFTLDDGAPRFGISRDAVRMRINRGRLRGSHAGGEWLVYLSDEQAERTELFTSADSMRITALERERDALAADKAWLQVQIESRGVELAEMRRLLGNAQQQLDGMVRALPAPPAADVPTDATAAPTMTTTSPPGAE